MDFIFKQYGLSTPDTSSRKERRNAYSQVGSKMSQMYEDVRARDPNSSVLPALKYEMDKANRLLNLPREIGQPQWIFFSSAAQNFHSIYSTWNKSFTKLEKQRKEHEAARKAQEEALQRQQREADTQRTYLTNVESGDLSGPGTPPTTISGGSQNVDSSRLDIGQSSTARRRRGRGISAQLGL